MLVLSGMVAEQRYDISRLSGSKRVESTPSGGARVPANLTRSGILSYRRKDGTVQLEFRSPEEVFKVDSLSTLQDAPLLEGHPAMVDPENWGKLTRGHVSGMPRQDGDYVAGYLAVQDGQALAKLDAGEAHDLSCGYTCKVRPWSGEWQGKRYDNILEQYDIKYNHVGFGKAGWGRAGTDVAVRLDGLVCDEEDNSGNKPAKRTKMKVRFDGKEYEAGSDEHVIALCTKIDSLTDDLKKAETDRDTFDGKLSTLQSQVEKLTADLATANDPKRLDSAVADRVKLVTDAAKVLGDNFKFDGLSAVEIQTAVVQAVNKDARLDGKSSEYIDGAYSAAILSGIRADGIGSVPARIAAIEARQGERTTRKDAAEKARVEQRTPFFEAPAIGGK